MKQLIYFIVLLSLVTMGCMSEREQQIKKQCKQIERTLKSKEGMSDIEIVNIDFADSILPCASNISVVRHTLLLSQAINDLQKSISNFKALLAFGESQIWIKTMTPEQLSKYNDYQSTYKRASDIQNKLKKESRNWRPRKNDNTLADIYIVAEFNATKDDQPQSYVGVFYYTYRNNDYDYNPYDFKSYNLFSKNDASIIKSTFLNMYAGKPLPSLEGEKIDVVPADEDPSMSLEERRHLRAQRQTQKEHEERLKRVAENKIRDEKTESTIKNGIRDYVKNMNRGGRTHVDEMTTFIKASFDGQTINMYYTIHANKSDYSSYQWEALKSSMEESIKSQCQNVFDYFVSHGIERQEVKGAFDRLRLNWQYIYRDYNGNHIFTIPITNYNLH